MEAHMKITDLKPGEIIFADGGFDCLSLNHACEVKRDDSPKESWESGLYVDCCGEEHGPGRHYLDGQLDWDDHETIVGFAREPWPQCNA